MSNTDVQDAGDTPSKRKTVSKRGQIDAAGNEVDKIEEATGARYTLLDPAGNHTFDRQFGAAADGKTMFGIFGFWTKVGNVVNTVLNDKDSPGSPSDAADSVTEFLALVDEGKWAERAPGGVGAKVDRDALAEAVVQFAISNGKLDESDTDAVGAYKAKVRQKLEDDAAWLRDIRKDAVVAANYARIVGKPAKSAADMLADI